MTLNEEIEADFFSGELDDLFEQVMWGDKPVQAMVNIVGVEEGFDEMGGATLGGVVREFLLRRTELMSIKSDLSMFGDTITYGDHDYDVNEIYERPNHPAITVRATLRA